MIELRQGGFRTVPSTSTMENPEGDPVHTPSDKTSTETSAISPLKLTLSPISELLEDGKGEELMPQLNPMGHRRPAARSSLPKNTFRETYFALGT